MPVYPRYNISRILDLRHRLYERLSFHYAHGEITGVLLRNMRDDICGILRQADPPSVERSLQYLVGTEMSDRDCRDLAARLAANERTLRRHDPVHPWSAQPRPEYVVVQVGRYSPHQTRKGQRGHLFYCSILAGTSAGLVMQKFLSTRFCGYISKSLGFSHKFAPFIHPGQLGQMRMAVLVTPESCLQGTPGFASLKEVQPTSLVKWNKELLRLRNRAVSGFRCPDGLARPVSLPCHLCPVGYEHCGIATHPLDYAIRDCPECKQPQSPFDDGLATKICLNCYYRDVYRHVRKDK